MYKTDGNWRKNLFYVVPEAENGFGTCYIDIIAQPHSERNKIFILLRSLCSGSKAWLWAASAHLLHKS